MSAPLFTVYTPCFNSAQTLPRVWNSLRAQTLRDFEWLVIDDGSTDGTAALLGSYAAAAELPVRIVRHEANVGMAGSFNRAVGLARGRLFLKADSDDAFTPEALKTFAAWWERIPASEREGFAGVTARCVDQAGRQLTAAFPHEPLDTTPAEVFHVHRLRGEKWGFTRTDLLRAHPFPDLDWWVPESAVWRAIGATHRTRYVNDVLRTYYRHTGVSVSDELKGRIRAPRGMAYWAVAMLNLEWPYARRAPRFFLGLIVTALRNGGHAGVSRRQVAAHLRRKAPRLLTWAMWPIAATLITWDRRRGRLPEDVAKGDWPIALDP